MLRTRPNATGHRETSKQHSGGDAWQETPRGSQLWGAQWEINPGGKGTSTRATNPLMLKKATGGERMWANGSGALVSVCPNALQRGNSLCSVGQLEQTRHDLALKYRHRVT